LLPLTQPVERYHENVDNAAAEQILEAAESFVIFRALYRRKLKAEFGQFLADEQLDKSLGQMSEWTYCKLLLPRRFVRLFGPPKMTEAEALTKVSCMATLAFREANSKAEEKYNCGDSARIADFMSDVHRVRRRECASLFFIPAKISALPPSVFLMRGNVRSAASLSCPRRM
jgi:hypothetical protein